MVDDFKMCIVKKSIDLQNVSLTLELNNALVGIQNGTATIAFDKTATMPPAPPQQQPTQPPPAYSATNKCLATAAPIIVLLCLTAFII